MFRRILTLLLAAFSWPLAGCQPAAPAPSTALVTQPAAGRIDAAATDSSSALKSQASSFTREEPDDGQTIEESWEAYSVKGVRVGYAHTRISQVTLEERALVRTRSVTHLNMQRAGQAVTQELTLTSWDTPSGQFVRFESQSSAGTGDVTAVGAVNGGKLGIDTTTLGRTQSQRIDWPSEWGGPFAVEQALRRQPLAPGEKRKLKCLVPMMNVPGETRLTALDWETAELPSGSVKLLKVQRTEEVGGQQIETTLWVDERGQTLKTLVPSFGLEAVRTTQAQALEQPSGERFDLQVRSSVPLRGKLAVSSATRRAVYRAHLTSGQIAGLFSDGPAQQVKPVDDRTVELTVVALRPAAAGEKSSPAAANSTNRTDDSQPAAADTAPNNMIQSDDRLIMELAKGLAATEHDPWKIACAFESYVRDHVRNQESLKVFSTAAEVARSREGDCTEHAVLLAALCRARQIPARVAFGLLYLPQTKSFEYHMWNEVWIADRWIPMDPTLGLGGIGADHLKLGDSNLSGGGPTAELISVIQVFGRLELEVLEAE